MVKLFYSADRLSNNPPHLPGSKNCLGITVASAHGAIPSDWFSVPLSGSQPTQLTHIQSLSLFASLSPDMKYIASYSVDGIFVMDLNGKSLTKVVSYTGGTAWHSKLDTLIINSIFNCHPNIALRFSPMD